MRLTKRDLLKAKNGAILQFSGEDNEIGNIVFNNNLALSSSSPVTMSMQQTFNIDGADAYFSNNINTSGSLSVDGATALANTLTVTQGSTLQGTLDVTGESIFAANTTVSGTLKAEGDLDFSASGGNLKAGTINALTVNSAGEVTKIGQDTPGGGQFLKWDGNKVVWDNASVNALSLDAITAATGSETRVQTSGNLHLDSTGGEIFLSSSDDFNFLSDDSNSSINFKNTGVATANRGQISLSIVDRGNNKSFSQMSFDGLFIRDKNNDDSSSYLTSFGLQGAEIVNSNDISSGEGILHIGTVNRNTSDSYGQNVTGSLLFSATDRRFIFCDSGRQQASASQLSRPKPFFHIKKIRSQLTDINTNFEVELNATKGTASYPLASWNNSTYYNHATFLKFNQDGQITKLGHDTPSSGQVLTWDDTNKYVVWSTPSAGSQTLSGLTDTDLTTTAPSEGDYLKYVSGKWVPTEAPMSTPTYLATTNSPITATINYHYSIDTSLRPVVINLPQAIMSNRGKRIIVKFKTGNNSLTVKAASGETIDSASNQTMSPGQTPGQSLILVSDGISNWEII